MIHQYKVALWPYQVIFADGGVNDKRLLPSSQVFERPTDEETPKFCLYVDDGFRPKKEGKEIGQFEPAGNHHGVYRTEGGGYQIRIGDSLNRKCALLETNADFSEGHVALNGDYSMRSFGLQNALMMMYAFATADCDTMLMHASVIRKDGYAYLFLGTSGTGKSTHTQHWMDYLTGCDLLNDDNPVARVMEGKVWVFGTPWSGKTPCYRNVQAEVGGFVQLKQAPYNRIKRQSVVEAFASLLSSCSVMKWDRRVYGGLCTGVTHVMEKTPTFLLENLPDEAAVRLSYETIRVK